MDSNLSTYDNYYTLTKDKFKQDSSNIFYNQYKLFDSINKEFITNRTQENISLYYNEDNKFIDTRTRSTLDESINNLFISQKKFESELNDLKSRDKESIRKMKQSFDEILEDIKKSDYSKERINPKVQIIYKNRFNDTREILQKQNDEIMKTIRDINNKSSDNINLMLSQMMDVRNSISIEIDDFKKIKKLKKDKSNKHKVEITKYYHTSSLKIQNVFILEIIPIIKNKINTKIFNSGPIESDNDSDESIIKIKKNTYELKKTTPIINELEKNFKSINQSLLKPTTGNNVDKLQMIPDKNTYLINVDIKDTNKDNYISNKQIIVRDKPSKVKSNNHKDKIKNEISTFYEKYKLRDSNYYDNIFDYTSTIPCDYNNERIIKKINENVKSLCLENSSNSSKSELDTINTFILNNIDIRKKNNSKFEIIYNLLNKKFKIAEIITNIKIIKKLSTHPTISNNIEKS